MFVNGLLGILTGIAMVALATNSFQADAAGVMGPGSTAGILILLGLGLAGLGIRGRKKIFQGTPPDGRYLALGMREVNLRGHPCFSEQEGRRANMNEDVLKREWKEIKGGVKEKWGKLTDDDLTYKDFIGRYKRK